MQLYKIELKSRFYGSKPLFWPSVSIDCRLILKRIKMWFFLKCKVFSQNCAKTLHLNNSKVYTNMLGLRYFWIVQQALNRIARFNVNSYCILYHRRIWWLFCLNTDRVLSVRIAFFPVWYLYFRCLFCLLYFCRLYMW